jgi:hypothetical protein
LRAWAWRRRHRLAFVGVAVLVALTVGYNLRRRWLEEAPRLIAVAQSRGVEALEQGQFDEAHRLLSQGARAAKSLGGAHRGAADVRQAAAEAAVIVNLVRLPLEELIEEAARSDPAEWPARFRDFHRGQTILVDALVASAGQPPERGPDLNLRLFPGRGPQPTRTGRIDTSGLELFQNVPPRDGDRLVFGAALDSLTLAPDGQWVFRLVPDSGVAITHWKALLALGWPDPSREVEPPTPAAKTDRTDAGLRNYTDQEVEALLGRPEARGRVATQGRVIEQWIYQSPRGRQFINFQRRPGEPRMTVDANFALP